MDSRSEARTDETARGGATRFRPRRRLWPALVLLLALLVVAAVVLTSVFRHFPDDERTTTPAPAGGGYVTGFAAGPHVTLARTDVGGAYRWDPQAATWSQVMNSSAGAARPGSSSVLAIAAGDDARTFVAAVGLGENGGLIRSGDAGATWKAAGPAMYVNGNENDRVGGSRLAHVGKGDVQFVYGSQRNGVMSVTTGGDVRPLPLPGVPGNADVGAVAAHPSAGLWIGVDGVGLFRSADARTFTKVAPAKAGEHFQKIVPTDSGTYTQVVGADSLRRLEYTASGATGSRKLSGGWSAAEAVDASPDGRRVIVIDGGTNARTVFTSADAGKTWHRAVAGLTGLDGSWAHILPGENWLSIGDVRWDPDRPDVALLGEGSGAFEIRDATSDHPTYHFVSNGIRELVTNDLAVTDAGTLWASYDRPVFVDRGDGSPSQVLTTRFNSAWSVATAPNDPKVVAALVDDRRECCKQDGLSQQSGLSTDGGLTWTRFPSIESGTHPADLRFGTLAVGHAPNPTLLWEASNEAGIWRSTDQGRTWTKTTTAPTGHKASFLRRHTLIADPTTKGKFWSFQADGLKVSTDDGRTWTPVPGSAAIPPAAQPWNARLIAVPGLEDGLVFSSGPLDEAGAGHWLTRDGGASWQRLTGADGANYLTAVADGDTTTLYTVRPDQKNVLTSTDLGATWSAVPDVSLPYQPSDITDLAVRHATGDGPPTLTVSYAGNSATTVPLPEP